MKADRAPLGLGRLRAWPILLTLLAGCTVGEILRQADLADTLQRFADGGFSGFYGGETAERFEAAMKAAGGLITAEDLAGYRSARREVLRSEYRGHEILAMPPVTHRLLDRPEVWVAGVPFFFAALFVVYSALIVVLVWSLRRGL